ncbi:hypothetical protein BpHYR1_036562, partial [Brachionus plicatilis]
YLKNLAIGCFSGASTCTTTWSVKSPTAFILLLLYFNNFMFSKGLRDVLRKLDNVRYFFLLKKNIRFLFTKKANLFLYISNLNKIEFFAILNLWNGEKQSLPKALQITRLNVFERKCRWNVYTAYI